MIGFPKKQPTAEQRSFLPEDYIRTRTERRSNLIAVTLFSVVTAGVVGAFLVTNREWHDVKHYQEAINVRYAQAAKEIEQLKQLEEQKSQLLEKAEMTTALIERVPRSILLAELTNRMPLDVTLLELEVKASRIADAPPPTKDDAKKGKGAKGGKAARNAKGEQEDVKPVVTAPKYLTKVVIVGVTNTHNSVAQYVASMQRSGLLSAVELKFSEKTMIDDREMNRFRIEAEIKPDADARKIEPAAAPRLAGDGSLPEASDPAQTNEEAAPATADAPTGGEP